MTTAKILLTTLWFFIHVGSSKGNNRLIQIEVTSETIPVASTFMPNHFQDLTASLSMDRKDATCASSDFTSNRRIDIALQNPSRIYALSLLMHKYVDVNVEVVVNNKENTTVCTKVDTNTGIEPVVFLNCKREIYGERITVQDLRKNPEFFVVCEVRVFGAPKAASEKQISSGAELLPVYIGCGVLAFLIVVVTVVVLYVRKSRTRTRHHSETHSLNTLSIMTGHPPMPGGGAVNRQHGMGRREPISVPRPTTVISRSVPNPYERPVSGKDPMPIYETLPGEESPYVAMAGDKTLYDDASSFKM